MPEGVNIIKEYAKDYILKNTGLKILALLITAVLWLSVASRLSQVIFPAVPIELINLPPSLAISKFDQASAKVFLRGPKDVIDALRSSDLAVVADLQNVEPGVRVIPLKIDLNRLPPSIDEQSIDIEPRNIRMTVEPLVKRDLPIYPRLDGELPPGYEMYGWTLSPASITIVAAASNLQEVKQVSTETVNIAERTETFSQQVAIDTGSPNISTVDESPKVMLTVIIGESKKVRVIDKVPVTLINAPANIQLFSKTVRVTLLGSRNLVETLSPEEIQVIADFATLPKGSNTIPLQVTVPNYSELVKVEAIDPTTIRIK